MVENRSERSQEFLRRSLKVSPGGAQTRSKRASSFPDNFPVGLMEARGARVWDIEGREYVDWICGLGAVSLGYKYPAVDIAVAQQLMQGGVSLSLPHYLEVTTSELLLDTLQTTRGLSRPEQVRWVKTGSEATAGAMMIARRYTKRPLIISIGYHGWHEAHQPSSALREASWGDMVSLYRAWDALRNGQVAGILLEACRDSEPPAGYLQGIQDLCHHYGALLISDECVTGFRWAIGGASEYFGFQPDLACFGKGIANGYPLACIVGPSRIMAHAVDVSGTYGGEAVSLAACKATLETYRKEPVIKHMWDLGSKFIEAGVAVGYPCHPRLRGSKEEVWAAVGRAASGGHLFHPSGFNISYSHTLRDVEESLKILAT